LYEKKTVLTAYISVFLVVLMFSTTNVSASTYTVGVKAGDWAGYGNICVEYAANWPGLEQEPPETNMSWVSMEILDVQYNNVTIRGSTIYANGTEETEVIWGDLAIGEGKLNIAIIPSNLGTGDEIPAESYGLFFVIQPPPQGILNLFINGTTTRKYAGANREVNNINFSSPIILGNVTVGESNMSYYWDKNTGVLCEHSVSSTMAYGTELYINMSLLWRMTATNMWPAVFTVQDGYAFNVTMISNSTISDFDFSESQMYISFNVTGPAGKAGYCNVTIPNDLLQGNPWKIYVNSTDCTSLCSITGNDTHAFIYIPYTCSTNIIKIEGTSAIPEFPSALILPLFMILTMLAVNFAKKRIYQKPAH